MRAHATWDQTNEESPDLINSCSAAAAASLVRLLLGRGVGRGGRGSVDHVDGRLVDRLVDEHGQVVVR